MSADRGAFRRYPLDGAALYFQPATGVHVRIASAATAGLRRAAPRVAMFGITNACNLACDFCSRDVARASEWTIETAAAALRGLHDAGTLEVAYGGGEPLAFRGLAELIAELDATTALAQHLTTNGTLLTRERWRPLAGRLGVVRLSTYDGVDWRAPAALLAADHQRWGANLLVDPPALAGLPATLAGLAAAGCDDVSLLSYVGPERARHLDGAGRARLAAIVGDSPLPCRLSVCFGDRVAVPTLATGDDHGDCGAGRDFVSITPDRRVQSCSFQERGLPGATAAEILAAWRWQQPALAAPSARRGCARTLPVARERAAPPPIAIWRAFSGNNSGECVMVATFEDAAGAEAYLAELLPGWTPDGDYSAAWKQLFVDEGVAGPSLAARAPYDDDASPRELAALGPTVVALQYAADDAFPELRALAWKRGAHVVPGGIHVHDGLALLLAVRPHDADDAARVIAAAPAGARLHRHGALVLGTVPALGRDDALATLADARAALLALVGERPCGVEVLFDEVSAAQLTAARQRLGVARGGRPRLWLTCWGGDGKARMAALAATMPAGRTTRADAHALVEPAPDRKRLAVLAYRNGAVVSALDGERVRLTGTVWHEPPPRTKGAKAPPAPIVDADHLEAALRATLPPASLRIERPEHGGHRSHPIATIETAEPAAALLALGAYARSIDARLNLWASEVDPLAMALDRVVASARR